MFLKKLFYASASILMLALAYHLGASTATAQAPSNSVVACGSLQNGGGWLTPLAITANGDAYHGNESGTTWTRVGNVFSGPATPTTTESFGALKAKYR